MRWAGRKSKAALCLGVAVQSQVLGKACYPLNAWNKKAALVAAFDR